ncbi:HGGxSTG domain-containing protein [Nocardioides marmotae]|uniref:HGGxSTG domain-containing protein n=1 Tax=Nocardioides marmotae TaxID=2663857 RepID=UPI0012B5AB9A|nr:HGGxSTG domain-containing protein [Nocardioides marmotae]MBC9734492.1 hypothetical protein [Nocardioides marmotae]MTB85592.1 hypothetical protein [Nocardioides marmotae]
MSKGNRKRRKRAGLLPTSERCVARNRFGEPCKKYPIEGAVVCASHGGAAPQVRRKAQERMLMAQDDAASLLVKALSDDRIPFAERRRCAEFLLTYETRNEVTVTLQKWEQDLEGVLVEVAEPDVVDAELAEDKRPAALPAPRAWDGRTADNVPPTYPRGEVLRWQR